ncbi:MAG: nicotinate (nicotinamide) nucleotide adenylyltransferase [Nitrospirae bacterium]|nr:nicotinate (nicotinamide) nucleotide adenylyltransferase [Nitrospirota bacterium]
MQRIGLFGGTFNPVHLGHLRIAGEIRERLSLDLIIFIPTGNPPHKAMTEVISPEHRLRMVELAIAPYSFFKASSIESERKGFSYSIDTVSALKEEIGASAEFFFIIGIDAFLEINTWKKADELLALCNFVVIPRPGHRFADLKDIENSLPFKNKRDKNVPPIHNTYPDRRGSQNLHMDRRGFLTPPEGFSDDLERLDRGEISSLSFPLSGGYFLFLEKIPLCDISSTELRKIVRNGGEVRNLLPETVMSYIMGQRLYIIDKKENNTNR